jgi:hypothetical protein
MLPIVKVQFINDELDEKDNTNNNNGITTTYILDVTSLENPVLTGYHLSPVKSIDHNLYILGDYSYMANYCSGLRVADVSGIRSGKTSEVAYFDVRPEDDGVKTSSLCV